MTWKLLGVPLNQVLDQNLQKTLIKQGEHLRNQAHRPHTERLITANLADEIS